jgi:hypothetical protein
VPAWLLFFTRAGASGDILDIDVPFPPEQLFGLAPENAEDMEPWPELPKGMLKRRCPASGIEFTNSLSPAEKDAYVVLALKTEKDLTRREIKFMRDLYHREAERQIRKLSK